MAMDKAPGDANRKLINIEKAPVRQCPQLKIIRIDMSVYFGSINHIQNRIASIVEGEQITHILVVGTGINFIDLAGAGGLVAETRQLKKRGGGLYFVGLKSSVYEFAAKTHMVRDIGRDHFFDSKPDAIHRLVRKLDVKMCETCSARVFRECPDVAPITSDNSLGK